MSTDPHAERIGLASDRLDNLLHAAQLPLPPRMHLEGILPALAEIRDELREVFVALTGENPWNEDDDG
jgi:hypothetical protein